MFFEGLGCGMENWTSIDSLTINGFQDWSSEQLYESEHFQAVRSRLSKLTLPIGLGTCDTCEHPAESLERARRYFSFYLPEKWLRPLQPQSTHLTLSTQGFAWGLLPSCVLRRIHFSKLRSLCFANWIIVQDWQIEWLLSLGKTLQQLILDSCPIITALDVREDPEFWSELEPIDTDGERARYIEELALRWYHVLPRLQAGLPRFKHFSIGRSSNSRRPELEFEFNFENRYNLVSGFDEYLYQIVRHSSESEGVNPGDEDAWPWQGFEIPAKPVYSFKYGAGQEKIVTLDPCLDKDNAALTALLEDLDKRNRTTVEMTGY